MSWFDLLKFASDIATKIQENLEEIVNDDFWGEDEEVGFMEDTWRKGLKNRITRYGQIAFPSQEERTKFLHDITYLKRIIDELVAKVENTPGYENKAPDYMEMHGTLKDLEGQYEQLVTRNDSR
jgi:hypothetical protein